jgi:hypothetical protein
VSAIKYTRDPDLTGYERFTPDPNKWMVDKRPPKERPRLGQVITAAPGDIYLVARLL